jgi:uncharacterized protein (DUF1800 family)
MKATRRAILRGGALGAGAAALSGCSLATRQLTQPDLPAHLAAAQSERPDLALRVLNRTAFGPRPGEVEQVRQMGVDAYLDEQLRAGALIRVQGHEVPTPLDDTPAAEWRVQLLDTVGMKTSDLYDWPKEQVQRELQQAAVLRAVYSRWQLREVMVDFWNDHFNVSQTKSDSAFMRTPYDAETIRKHSLGRFRELLGATAESPAMLYYLDNARSKGGKAGKPNENYARELMELHTLGVNGGYTQKDVYEVARCFTGWTIKEHYWAGSYEYNPDWHDPGDKVVLGHPIRGRGGPAGKQEAAEVLDILAAHPSTAHFLAYKLCRRFVQDDPPAALVGRVAKAFHTSNGHVAAAMHVIVHSQEFRSGSGMKLKRPFDYVVSSLRALNADTDGAGPLQHLALMGQLPYHWAMPNGYPDRASAWAVSLLARWNYALALVTGGNKNTAVDLPALARAAGAETPGAVVSALASLTLGCRLPAGRQALFEKLAAGASGAARLQQVAAALLAAPEFQWR